MNRLRPLQALIFLAVCLLCLDSAQAQQCPDPALQTSGSHSFRQQGESFNIVLSDATHSQIDCQPIALELRWSNGRNNGSNFHVTFLDSDNQPIYTKELSGFMTGNFQFPFATLEPQPWLRSGSMMSVLSVPATVVIQAVRPFAFPASISYTVRRIARPVQEQTASSKQQTALPKGESADYAEGKASTHRNEY